MKSRPVFVVSITLFLLMFSMNSYALELRSPIGDNAVLPYHVTLRLNPRI
jgi:hypothetical protein